MLCTNKKFPASFSWEMKNITMCLIRVGLDDFNQHKGIIRVLVLTVVLNTHEYNKNLKIDN